MVGFEAAVFFMVICLGSANGIGATTVGSRPPYAVTQFRAGLFIFCTIARFRDAPKQVSLCWFRLTVFRMLVAYAFIFCQVGAHFSLSNDAHGILPLLEVFCQPDIRGLVAHPVVGRVRFVLFVQDPIAADAS